MGANEKHGAAYHWCTQEVADIREKYVYSRGNDGCREDESRTEFDRMIARVRAEAKAEALEEAASEIYRLDGDDAEMYNEDLNATPVTAWLRARANLYKEDPNNGR